MGNSRPALILGGSAFIGTAIVEALLAKNMEVTVANRGLHDIQYSGAVRRIRVDRTDSLECGRIYRSLETSLVVDVSAYRPEETRTAVEAFSGRIDHFIHLSTVSVYDDAVSGWIDETAPLRGVGRITDGYAGQKRACESALLETGRQRMPTTILRLGMVVGPGDPVLREGFYVARMQRWKELLLPLSGAREFQNVYVGDVGRVIASVANNRRCFNKIYNVCSPEFWSADHYLLDIAEACGWDSEIVWLSPGIFRARGIAPESYPFTPSTTRYYTVTALENDTHFSSWTPLDQALKEVALWLNAKNREIDRAFEKSLTLEADLRQDLVRAHLISNEKCRRRKVPRRYPNSTKSGSTD